MIPCGGHSHDENIHAQPPGTYDPNLGSSSIATNSLSLIHDSADNDNISFCLEQEDPESTDIHCFIPLTFIKYLNCKIQTSVV